MSRVEIHELLPAKPPRAVQVPTDVTWGDFDELVSFCFEYFTDNAGVFRLYVTSSEDAEDEVREEELARIKKSGAPLLLDDRDRYIAPVNEGDWLVEPNDGGVDGFIVLTDDEFQKRYRIAAAVAS